MLLQSPECITEIQLYHTNQKSRYPFRTPFEEACLKPITLSGMKVVTKNPSKIEEICD